MKLFNKFKKTYKFFFPFLPIVILFILYPIPPIADYIGHVSMSLVPTGSEEFYTNRFNITYQTLHWILKLPQLITGPNFSVVSAWGIIFMFFTLLSIPGIYTKMKKGPALLVMGILTAPTLFLIHSRAFLWGVFPFALGAWLSCLFILLYNYFDSYLIENRKSKKILILCTILLLITILAHPISILYIGMGMGLILAKILLAKAPNKFKRLCYTTGIVFLLLIATKIEQTMLGKEGSLDILWEKHNMWERFLWIASDHLYKYKGFFPSTDYYVSDSSIFLSFMSLLPFIALVIQAGLIYSLHKRGKSTSLALLIFCLLIISCGMLITIPAKYDKLSIWPERHLLFIMPLILIVFSEFIILFQKKLKSKKVIPIAICISFLLSTGVAYLHSNVYAKAQNIKIVADEIVPKIIDQVNNYREITDYNGIVLIQYIPTSISNSQWLIYRLIPIMLISNSELINNGIAIKHEWETTDGHLPVKLNIDFLTSMNAPTLHWDQTTYPEITLSPT